MSKGGKTSTQHHCSRQSHGGCKPAYTTGPHKTRYCKTHEWACLHEDRSYIQLKETQPCGKCDAKHEEYREQKPMGHVAIPKKKPGQSTQNSQDGKNGQKGGKDGQGSQNGGNAGSKGSRAKVKE